MLKHQTPRLLWCDHHSLGIDACDDEHKMIFMLCNDFSRAVESRVSAVCATNIFATLACQIRTHFTREDRVLAHRGLALGPQRVFARRTFRRIAENVDACLRVDGNRSLAAASLRDWILGHVAADHALLAGLPGPAMAAMPAIPPMVTASKIPASKIPAFACSAVA